MLNEFISMGAIAMTGFFMLSGYALNLSTQKINMCDAKEIRKFYLKRLISILPLYYAYAIINVIINIAHNGMNAVVEETLLLPIETLGLQSVFASLFSFSHNNGSWFISCILICYFVFPMIHNVSKGLSDKTRIAIIAILSAVMLWSPLVQHYFHTSSLYSNPFFRMFEFTIGLLVCQMNVKQDSQSKIIGLLRKPYISIITVCVLVAGVSIARRMGIPSDYMLYNWIALPCFMSLLISLGYIKFEKLQESKTVQYLSALSFSIFLSQLTIVWHTVRYGMKLIDLDINLANIIVSAAICFVLANLYHFYIEIPSAKYLKNKFLK